MTALWLTEADVVALLSLPEAIEALERSLKQEAAGDARNMAKTHAAWGGGHTLHAIGAVMARDGVVGTKSWAHTAGGATPLLILWDSQTGGLLAVIEAFALGQMRTGGMTGVATRWLAAEDADAMAVIGSGKQALTQVAAVHAVRPLRTVSIFSPTAEHRERLAATVRDRLGIAVTTAATAAAAVADMPIVSVVTRAREPIIEAAQLVMGAHINAIGAITPDRQELAQDVLLRADEFAVDSLESVRRLSREFIDYFETGPGDWAQVRPISAVIAAGRGRRPETDLSLFKAMGMGISDLALGIEILSRAKAAGRGRPQPQPERAEPRLT